MTPETKVCTKCGQRKQLDKFGVNRRNKDGLDTRCKDCIYGLSRQWDNSNRPRRKRSGEEKRRWRPWAGEKEYEAKRCEVRRMKTEFKHLGDEPAEWVTE